MLAGGGDDLINFVDNSEGNMLLDETWSGCWRYDDSPARDDWLLMREQENNFDIDFLNRLISLI